MPPIFDGTAPAESHVIGPAGRSDFEQRVNGEITAAEYVRRLDERARARLDDAKVRYATVRGASR